MSIPAPDVRPPMVDPSAPQVKSSSFWQSSSGLILLTFLCVVLVFIISAGVDILLIRRHEPARLTIELSDGVSSLVIGLLSYKLIRSYQERRVRLRKRLEVISDMNHHVRNALQIIALTAHGKDKQEIAAIQESVNRIQWALRELLPKI
jgi:uncharacterized membrane protein YbhN (UPF0104 family)